MRFKDLPPDTRPREKILTKGPKALADAELLAILLRTGTKGRSVLALANDLITLPAKNKNNHTETELTSKLNISFDGLAGLLHANAQDLAQVKGLGPAKSAEILAVMELAKRALSQQLKLQSSLNSPEAVRQYLQAHIGACQHEVFAVVFLDCQLRLIALEEMFRGSLTQSNVYPREIALRALQLHAHAIILSHNHPSGNVMPSQTDILLTQQVRKGLQILDIRLLDHIIVSQGKSLSLAEQGYLKDA